MSERISYGAWLAAKAIAAERDASRTDFLDPSECAEYRRDAAIGRSLAALVEIGQAIHEGMARQDAIAEARNDTATHDLRPLLALLSNLAAGYDPTATTETR